MRTFKRHKSFFSSGENERNMKREKKCVAYMRDSEIMRCYTLDRAAIMFVTDLFRDTLTSPTPRRNDIVPEMEVITTLTYLATGKMQLCSSDDLGLSQPSISKVITQTITALSEPYCVAVHFL